MQITDINGKLRTIKDLPKLIIDTRQNEVNKVSYENIDGELATINNPHIVEVNEKFVEVIIIGRNREWVEWYPLQQFEERNPHITF